MDVTHSSTSHSRPRSNSNLIDVFFSLNQLTSSTSYDPHNNSSYVCDSSFGDDSYHQSEHLTGRREDFSHGTSRSNVICDNHYIHNSTCTSHSQNVEFTGSRDYVYRSAGNDARDWKTSDSGERDRGPVHDDCYVHHEHSPDRCPGPGHDGRHSNRSGSGKHDRGPVHDDHYVHHEHSPDRCPGPGHDGQHRNKSGSGECDRGPVHDDHYVHHEHSPDRCPGPGHDGQHCNKSGSGEHDRGPVHDDCYVRREHSPDRHPGPGHDVRHHNKSGSGECDRGPVHDDRYVCREHSPDRCPSEHRDLRTHDRYVQYARTPENRGSSRDHYVRREHSNPTMNSIVQGITVMLEGLRVPTITVHFITVLMVKIDNLNPVMFLMYIMMTVWPTIKTITPVSHVTKHPKVI